MKYRIGVYEKAFPEDISINEMLFHAKNSGYDNYEISIDRTDQRIKRVYSSNLIGEIKGAILNNDMPIESIALSAHSVYSLGHFDAVKRKKGIDIFARCIDFALEIGARIIQIPGCDVPKGETSTEDTDKYFLENLAYIAEYASKYGIMIGLENMETEYMQSVKKCMRAINYIDSPYFQLYPDAGNITSASKLENTDPVDDMYTGKGHYLAYHLKETRPDKYGGLFYGEGHVDFERLVHAAWNCGVRKFVMEYWYTGNPMWTEDLVKAREFADKILMKCAEGEE